MRCKIFFLCGGQHARRLQLRLGEIETNIKMNMQGWSEMGPDGGGV